MARPKKKISEKLVRKLASIQCSYAEIAAVVGCDESTLTRRFAQAIKEGRERGCRSLKRRQWEIAMDKLHPKAPTMLIWLGKQYLGQSDQRVLQAVIEQQKKQVEELSDEQLLAAAKTIIAEGD